MNNKDQTPKDGRRYLAMILLVLFVFGAYAGRLVQWQLVEGESYEEISKNQSTQFIRLSAARGEILDSDGNVLVGNHLTYAVNFNAMTMAENRNPTLILLLTILKEQGESWNDDFPIVIDEEGNYVFDETMESEIEYLKSSAMLNLQEYATADDCMKALVSRYNCNGYSTEDTRDLLSVRYAMHKHGFSRTNPYTIADDVSPETVGIINERIAELPGVETKIIDNRYYGEDTALASHVIGTVGTITESQYEAEREKDNLYSADNVSGYSLDDRVGLTGIESAFESELRGTYGKEVVTTDSSGDVTSTTVIEAPKSGNTVQLTLRADLQKVANDSLRNNILNNSESDTAVAGAAVMLDVNDGSVLAAANYPTFDLEAYYNDTDYYNALIEDSNNPMFNRAFFGEFTPGSVFKPLVAIAALEENSIHSGTAYNCSGVFEYYDLELGCLGIHGYETVTGAIRDSCNVFFYQTGLAVGIDKMNAYAEYFGLGQRTGVETGESAGTMSNEETYLEKWGQPWATGNTAQTAIGQLDSVFTPLQLATYCATIANDGKRYQTHLMDKIIDYNTGEVIEEYQPTVVMDANISASTMSTVKQGMLEAASYGTARSVFSDYEYSIAAKTGTAETSAGKATHLTFIAYASASDPEVAVAVVMEYGNKGEYAMNVAKDMLDAYFEIDRSEEDEDDDDDENIVDDEDGEYDDLTDEEGNLVDDTDTADEDEMVLMDESEMDIGAFYDPERDVIFKKAEDIDGDSETEDPAESSSEPLG